jgi:hypothetical protein
MTTKLIDGVKDFVKQDFIVLKLLQLLVLLVRIPLVNAN